MRYLLMLVMLLLSLILPGTVFYFWSWGGVKPDLIILFTIYIALHHRPMSGALWGLGAGVLEDLYLGRYFGMYSLTLTGVALLSSWLAQRWNRGNFPLITLLAFWVTLAGQILIALLSLGVGVQWTLNDALRLMIGVSLYNAILVPISYPWIHRSFLKGWLKYRPKYER